MPPPTWCDTRGISRRAVDNESVEKGERYYSAAQRCQKFYVFHSKNDPVLRTWYRIGDFFDFDTALGYSGPEDPRAIMDHSRNVTVINCKDIVSSHGGYRSTGQVWSFMQQELATPGTEQFVTLEKNNATLSAMLIYLGDREEQRLPRTRDPLGIPNAQGQRGPWAPCQAPSS